MLCRAAFDAPCTPRPGRTAPAKFVTALSRPLSQRGLPFFVGRVMFKAILLAFF